MAPVLGQKAIAARGPARLALERHQLGPRVVRLTDGALALDYLLGEGSHARDIRFIILDLKLPKVDGLQVLERIKADPRTRSIPRSFESGVNSYVVKPVQLDEYMDKISAVARYWDKVNERPVAA